MPMKAVQFTIDEALLTRLDAEPAVKARGRSEFIRRAIEAALKRRREQSIRAAYRRGYGEQPVGEEELVVAEEARPWPGE